MSSRKWEDLTTAQKVCVVVLAAVQITLALTAWSDLARRSADQVNGRKSVWAAVIAINFVGPVLYFRRGRRTVGTAPAAPPAVPIPVPAA